MKVDIFTHKRRKYLSYDTARCQQLSVFYTCWESKHTFILTQTYSFFRNHYPYNYRDTDIFYYFFLEQVKSMLAHIYSKLLSSVPGIVDFHVSSSKLRKANNTHLILTHKKICCQLEQWQIYIIINNNLPVIPNWISSGFLKGYFIFT